MVSIWVISDHSTSSSDGQRPVVGIELSIASRRWLTVRTEGLAELRQESK